MSTIAVDLTGSIVKLIPFISTLRHRFVYENVTICNEIDEDESIFYYLILLLLVLEF